MEWLMYAIVAGLSLLANHFSEKKEDERQIKSQEWQEKMMDKQNEYDTPENKIARAESAGVNPVSMMMGNGSIFGGSSASAGSTSYMPYGNPMDLFGSQFSNLMQGQKAREESITEKSLRQLRAEQIQEQNQETKQIVIGLGLKNAEQKIINDYARAREYWAVMGQKSTYGLNITKRAELNKSIQRMQYELETILPEQLKDMVAKRELDVLNLDKVVAEISSLEVSSEKDKAMTDLVREQVQTEGVVREEHQSNISVNESRVAEVSKVIEKYDAEITKIAEDTNLTKEQVYWYVFDKLGDNAHRTFGIHWGRNAEKQQDFLKEYYRQNPRVYYPN